LQRATANSGMTKILTPTREQLITAWHKRCPALTRLEAAMSFDEWWECGCLDIKRDEKTGEWRVLLSEGRSHH
jgi:hypothetical protein